MKVDRIKLEGFRGATSTADIPFDISKTVILIFGENGTGKSTIVDAFDFICNQGYGSLGTYSLGGSAKKFVPSLGTKPESIKVTLMAGSSTWEAGLGKSGPIVKPEKGCPDARILRRRSILSFIEDQPKQRYDVLRPFIAIPGIENSEKSLRDAIKTGKSNLDESARSIDQAQNALNRLWIEEGSPGKSSISWAQLESSKDIGKLNDDVTSIVEIDLAYQAAENSLETLNRTSQEIKKAKEALVESEEKQKAVETRQINKNADLLKLLQDAKMYIDNRKTITQCPVCEQKIDPAPLVSQLQGRINEMQELCTFVSVVAASKQTMLSKTSIAKQAQRDFCEKMKTLGTILKSVSFEEILVMKIEWQKYGNLLADREPDDETGNQARGLYSTVSTCRKNLQTRKESSQKSVNHHNAIKGHTDTIQEKKALAKSYEDLIKQLDEALEIVSKERKDFIEYILSQISGEVEDLYSKIHPDENIGKLRFYLNPKTICSLEFDAQFYNCCDLPPQAYYSESHLDTLGICVFLSLSKFYKSENTILILDDVFTSVDGPHLERFMSLLHDEAKNFNQMIVTTHYRPWRERYRWAKGSTANTQLIELGPWSLQNGLKTGEFLTAIEELQSIIDGTKQFDRQAAASKAGIVLESLLDFITLKYHCAVPRNVKNEYTLGDLVYGVDSKLSKELRCRMPSKDGKKIDIDLKLLLNAATSSQWVRNCVGCHFNILGTEVSDQEVKDFCKNVLKLANHLICPDCKTLPTRRPSGSYWQCRCGKLELYPLIYPGADPGSIDDEV